MVQSSFNSSGICLLYPSRSLLWQVWEWIQGRGQEQFHLLAANTADGVRDFLRGGSIALIDGSEHPSLAAEALDTALPELGSERVVVYSERTNQELEILTRTCRAHFLLGPMNPAEWNDLFTVLNRQLIASRV